MNRENILKVADAIEKGTLVKRGIGFNMALIADEADDDFVDHIDNCGTVCCIAGAAFAVRFPRVTAKSILKTDSDITGWAADYLGLDSRRASELFYPLVIGPLQDIRPRQAIAVLRHLADTGVVDWSVAPPADTEA